MVVHQTMLKEGFEMTMQATTPARRGSLPARATCALLVGTLAVQTAYTPVALAEAGPAACSEPKRDSPFLSKEWRMAKVVDFGRYLEDQSGDAGMSAASALLSTAVSGGSLEEYGKAIASAVLDSYVPGISSMFDQQEDPLVAQTRVLLDAIDELEANLIRANGDGWAEFRYARRQDIQDSLANIREDIRSWHNDFLRVGGGWSVNAVARIGDDVQGVNRLLTQMESTILTPGSADGIAEYPYLSMLEIYTEATQLYWLNNPLYLAHVHANEQGIVDTPSFNASSIATRALIDQNTRITSLGDLEASMADALAFAENVSEADPFRERANWMVSEAPRQDYPFTVDCGNQADTDKVVADALHVLGFLGYPCAARIHDRCADPFPTIYAYTSNAMNPDFTTTKQKHCIVKDALARGWWSTYDGFGTMYATPDEAFAAHQQGAYNALLRVGWGPFSITLDKWWAALRAAGQREGLRPTLALDRRLDNYLLDTDGPSSIGYIMRVLTTYSEHGITQQQAALLVNYALEFGPEQLFRLATEQWLHDKVFFPSYYPIEDRLRFVMQTRDPEKMTAYFKSLQTARIMSVL
jgi:hypothetical protein